MAPEFKLLLVLVCMIFVIIIAAGAGLLWSVLGQERSACVKAAGVTFLSLAGVTVAMLQLLL
ncbi:hypothetical protein ABZS72_22420 [Streptomyces albidoflavus]|uniref:hypothetical protein n=1 Tax=Streptomyces albidoflavus TaxID=1886 RepID=UPI00339E6B45